MFIYTKYLQLATVPEWVWQQLSIRDFPRYIERKNPRVSWKKYYRYFYLRNSETFRANRIYRQTFRSVYSKVPKTGTHLFFLASCYGGMYLTDKVIRVAEHYFQDSLLSHCIQIGSCLTFIGSALGSVIIGDKIFSNRKIKRKISSTIAKINSLITRVRG